MRHIWTRYLSGTSLLQARRTDERAYSEVVAAVVQWRAVALSIDVGLTSNELGDFEPAFEHAELEEAKEMVNVNQLSSNVSS